MPRPDSTTVGSNIGLNPAAPVGVFDSGVGGLAVLFELQRIMPVEAYCYFADTLNCPWGSRTDDEILELAGNATETLLTEGCKVIVVACNSATTVALSALRQRYAIPFVGTEPAIKPAALQSFTGRIGVLATQATVRSGSLQSLTERFATEVKVSLFAGPDRLVELVEDAVVRGPEVDCVLRPILDEVRDEQVDVLVLGCTHYTFLRGAIESMLGPDVAVLDTGEPVARQAQRLLEKAGALAPGEGLGGVRYRASADPEALARTAEMLRAV